tara:strand:- start:7623 stop:9347 length:1725 start_codon:yes stop_codon:yes gene_type:complete
MKHFNLLFFIIFYSCANQPVDYFSSEAPRLKNKYQATSEKLMISSQGNHSTNAGIKIAKMGGNIIDVFTAVSFAISVERPQSTGLGGGGFLLYYDPSSMDEPVSLDFREMAPLRAHKKMYVDSSGNEIPLKSRVGMDAAGVPGFVDGVLTAHKKWGKLPLNKVLAPAVDLAREGFVVYPELEKALNYKKDDLAKFPATKKIFFRKSGEVLKAGDLLKQTDLSKTIEYISLKGKDGFYKGYVRDQIVQSSKVHGSGFFQKKDFNIYKTKFRATVKGSYKGYPIYSMGPPSSGGVHVIQILNTLENLNLVEPYGKFEVHAMSSAMMQAFYDRAKYLGDADFVNVPIDGLTSKGYADDLSKEIKNTKAFDRGSENALDPFKYESDETTHFSIMDSEGRVVVTTQTINGYFGNSVVVEGTGVVMNNEMDDFATKVGASNLFGAIGGKNNLVEARKRPLSSMSPTIVLDKESKSPLLAVGTPSGTRILTCVMQTILNYLEYENNLYDSVAMKRYHHQWRPNYIRVEGSGFSQELSRQLKDIGHELKNQNLGCRVQAIEFRNNKLTGVSDPRGEGKSQGL